MCKMKSLNNTPTQSRCAESRQAPDSRNVICYDHIRLFVKSLGTACASYRSLERDCGAQLAVGSIDSAAELQTMD